MNRPRRWAWGSAALVVVAASILVSAPQLPFGGAAGAADQPFTVTVTPADLLGDGQLISVTIKTDASFPVSEAEMQVCNHGASFQTSKGARPNNDFVPGGDNCPNIPVSTSANLKVSDTTVSQNATTVGGSVSKYRVGVGTQSWTDVFDHSARTINCGPDSQCDLVVEVRGGPKGQSATWFPVLVPLTFKDTDPIAGCGGPAPGILQSGGSDRMQDAWISWTLNECHRDGSTGGASRATFTGEGAALNTFAFRPKKANATDADKPYGLDLAYSAAGYGNEVGLLQPPANAGETPRQAVAVPVGLNAAVIAVAGGHRNDTGVKVPYDDLRLTQSEVAQLLSAGPGSIRQSFRDSVQGRNPELVGGIFDSGSNTAGFLVGAPAEAESNSWFMTEELLKNAPDDWKVPNLAQFGDDAGRARGADAALATADPTYALSLTTLTGRPPLANGVAKVISRTDTQGGVWVLTDLETANALGMTVVKIANHAGEFVPVDQASVTAGVKSMKQTDNGMLLPDPTAVVKVDGTTPYPLAFVEYAMVPAEPLVDKDCKARTDSQELLTKWLTYVTGDGQAKLPAGMFPLTPDLQAHAASAIDQVGKAPVTGTCAGHVLVNGGTTTTTTTVPATTTTTVAASTDGGTNSGVAVTVGGGSSGGTTGGPGANAYRSVSTARSTPVASTPSTGSSTPTTSGTTQLTSVPTFSGRRSVGWTGALLALIGVVALGGVAGMMASGATLADVGRVGRRP